MKIEMTHMDEFISFMRSCEERGNIYVVGAGEFGKLIGKFLTENAVAWKGYVDGYLKESDEIETGKVICSYASDFSEKDFFVISSQDYADAMEKQLRAADIQEDHILYFTNIKDIVWEISGADEDWSKYFRKVQRFRNLYQGQRCFIIGNAPSLTIEDLEKLKNEVTFACNLIYALYDKTEWRPTYYCTIDSLFLEKRFMNKKEIMHRLSGCQAAFTTANGCTRLVRDEPDLDKLFYVRERRIVDGQTGLPFFSDDFSKCYYNSYTVAYTMLQLAVYMGFHEIYLLGIDMAYSFGDHKEDLSSNYTEELRAEIEKIKPESDKINQYDFGFDGQDLLDNQKRGYLSARRYADDHGIKIYNATRGGCLEVFDRVALEELFE